MGRVRVSVLDLAPVGPGETASDSFAGSVALARLAEALGYERVWYAEHHNFAAIASSATSVLIAHVGAHTQHDPPRRRRRHAAQPRAAGHRRAVRHPRRAAPRPDRPRPRPSTGHRPGHHARALRRASRRPIRFPQDVLELQGYLSGHTLIPGVDATPGKGTNVPLYILGSSLFGAQLAAALGLPYAFASHFAPAALEPALAPTGVSSSPPSNSTVPTRSPGSTSLAADSTAAAQRHLLSVRRARAVGLFGRQLGITPGAEVSDDQADRVLGAGAATHVDEMLTYTAAGTPSEVRDYLHDFLELTGADELMTVHSAPTAEDRLRSVTLLAQAVQTATA